MQHSGTETPLLWCCWPFALVADLRPFALVHRSDEFILECPKLGRLERIRIGHDNSGFGPGWYLDKVRHPTLCPHHMLLPVCCLAKQWSTTPQDTRLRKFKFTCMPTHRYSCTHWIRTEKKPWDETVSLDHHPSLLCLHTGIHAHTELEPKKSLGMRL